MPAILDVAIGTIFVFLLFSLVVSAANEIVLSFLDKRAEFLKEGLKELLRNSGSVEDQNKLVEIDHILKHGLVSALSRGTFNSSAENTAGVPSYIPGKSFVLALLSEVQTKSGVPITDWSNGAEVRSMIEKIANKELKETLLALHDDAGGRLDHFKANIENWFNQSMDRVSGWYTRYAKQCMLGIGLILAVIGNVDTIHVAQSLAEPKNEALRKAVVDQAIDYAKKPREPAPVGVGAAPAVAVPAAPAAPAKEPSDGAPGDMQEIKHFQAALAEMEGTGLPMGWNKQQQSYFQEHVLTVIAGWVLTALAASLGAPFWFDMLNRFVDIRSNGRAPEESDPTAPKKQSTGVETYVVTGDSLKGKGTPATKAEQSGVAVQETAQTAIRKTRRKKAGG